VPVARLTKRSVEAVPLPEKGKRAYLWDDQLKGFGVMVMPTAVRSYLVQYRMDGRAGRTQRYTIGKHGSPWTCDQARDRAADLLADIRKGINPVHREREQREKDREGKADAARLAFDGYVETFGKKYVDVGGSRAKGKGKPLRSGTEIKAVLRREWVPVFKSRPLSAIRKNEIVDALDVIVERSMSTAIKAHKWLRRLFEWAVERGDIGASPMDTIPAPGTDGERERVLKGQELRALWLGAGAMHEPYASFVKMLTLTGQRLREVAHMDWRELDLDKAVWVIPGARTKNKLDHLVPLAPLAVSILIAIKPRKADRKGPVFTTDGAKPINGFSKPKAALDEKVSAALTKLDMDSLPLIEPWVFHDLRRSFFTGGQALGFPREHMHAAVNHAPDGKRAGLAKVYGLYEYQPEKTAVMAAWTRHIEALLDGGVSNVVPLAAARVS
jgi:integrase